MASDEDRGIVRQERGRWGKGTVAGPGRPRVPDWLRGHTDELLRLQLEAATEGTLPAVHPESGEMVKVGVSVRDRLTAGAQLLDRLLGKPVPIEDVAEDDQVGELVARLATALEPVEAELRAEQAREPDGVMSPKVKR